MPARERPILFSPELVNAITRKHFTKTVTRRVVKPRHGSFPPASHPRLRHSIGYEYIPSRYTGSSWTPGAFMLAGAVGIARDEGAPDEIHCPYGGPGDLLWVREPWTRGADGKIYYRADSLRSKLAGLPRPDLCPDQPHPKWKPSIHMRREDSRLLLRITAVRVERLKKITEAEAALEGVDNKSIGDSVRRQDEWVSNSILIAHQRGEPRPTKVTQVGGFATLWNRINPKHPWSSDPFVWVVSFERTAPSGGRS